MALRIGVNALYLLPGQVGGTEIYLRNLLAALAAIDTKNRYFVFTNRETGRVLAPRAANFTTLPQRVGASSRPARIIWEQTALPLAMARRGVDVLLNPGFTAPLLSPAPQVTVFHDLQYMRHPEFFRRTDLVAWRALLFWSAHLSRLLLADSHPVRRDLLHYYRLPPEKVRVVELGVAGAFFELRREPDARDPYLLAVSTLHPHKNLDRLLRVFREFHRARPEFRLVITGLRGFAARELTTLCDELGLAASVTFTGWVPRDQLYDLFAKAWAFVYPSLFEGFGLPVLEALAAGIPAACSAIEPISSIAGDAALQFDPRSEHDMLRALARVVDHEPERRRLAAAGPPRAAQYSWEATAAKTLDALEAAAER